MGRLRRVGPHPLPLGPPPPPAVSGPKPSVVCGPAPACLPPVGGRPPLFAHLPSAGRPLPSVAPSRAALGLRLRRGPPALAHPGRAPPAACPWSRPLSGGACGPRRLVGPCPWAACRALLCRARAGPPPGPFWGAPLLAPGGCGGCRSGCPLGVAFGPPGRFFLSAVGAVPLVGGRFWPCSCARCVSSPAAALRFAASGLRLRLPQRCSSRR